MKKNASKDLGRLDFDDNPLSDPFESSPRAGNARRPSVSLTAFESEQLDSNARSDALQVSAPLSNANKETQEVAADPGIVTPESLVVDSGCTDPDEAATALWETRRKEENEEGLKELEDKERMRIIQLQTMTSMNMLSPEAGFRSKWDIVQVFMLAYIGAAVPYRIGFSDPVVLWSSVFWVDLVMDLYFIVDLFLNFRTAIRTGDGELVFQPTAVAKIYLTSWFPVDFLSCLPLNYIEYYHAAQMVESTSNLPAGEVDIETQASKNRLSKLARLGRVARLLKILRLVRFKKLIERYEEELYSVGAFRLMKLVVAISILAHWLACAWYYFGTWYAPDPLAHHSLPDTCFNSQTSYWGGGMDGETVTHDESAITCQARCSQMAGCAYFTVWSNGDCLLQTNAAHAAYDAEAISGPRACELRAAEDNWVEEHFGSVDVASKLSTGGHLARYFASVYFAFMTLTTVGYGDVHPLNAAERVYSCIAMLIGGFMFGMIVGSLAEIIRKSNPGDTARNKRTGAVHAFLHDRKVPRTLSLQIRTFYRSWYTEWSAMPNEIIFHDLPEKSKKALATALDYIPGTTGTRQGVVRTLGITHRIPFFNNLAWWDVVKICNKLKLLLVNQAKVDPNTNTVQSEDNIMTQGAIEYEMYIIVDGVCMLTKDDVELGRVRKYDFFGELAVVLGPEVMRGGGKGPRRTRTAYAFTKCDLVFLNVDDMLDLMKESPAIESCINAYVKVVFGRQPSSVSRTKAEIEHEALISTKSLFEHVDAIDNGGNGTGQLTKSQLAKLLSFPGLNPKNATVEGLMAAAAEPADGAVKIQTFMAWWLEQRQGTNVAEQVRMKEMEKLKSLAEISDLREQVGKISQDLGEMKGMLTTLLKN